MKTYTISELAKLYGLSRSTLLYYDRINLLPPSGRTPSGYRIYTGTDSRRLARICEFRQAGLTLADIRATLLSDREPAPDLIENRLREIEVQIQDLKNKQRLLSGMLKHLATGGCPALVDKRMWVEMLRAAGMDDDAMDRWHAEFERRSPDGHREFLASIGIPEREIRRIRAWSRRLVLDEEGAKAGR